MKKRILYLVTRESVLDAGVLKSQVFELLGRIKSENKNSKIVILNFPSLNRFLRNISKYIVTKKYASRLGIKLIIIPILPIGRSIMPRWAIPFLLIQTIPFVMFISWKEKINIYHARAYLSSVILYFIKKYLSKIEFIFDARGPYLLEGLTHSRWNKDSVDFKYWEKLEKKLFEAGKVVVAQSIGFTKYIKKVGPKANVYNIPCCADIDNYDFTREEILEERKKLNIQDKFVVVYSGSLGSFHDPEFLVKVYSSLRSSLPNPHFLVLTHSITEKLLESLLKYKINESEFTVIHNPDSLPKYIALGDIGLHVMKDLPITPLVIAVKFSEYLSFGLPIIISKNMTSLTDIIETKGCGIVLDTKNQNNTAIKVRNLVKNYNQFKINAQKLARAEYSTEVVARKYAEIYKTF